MRGRLLVLLAILLGVLSAAPVSDASPGDVLGHVYVPVFMDYYRNFTTGYQALMVRSVENGAVALVATHEGKWLAYYGFDGSWWRRNLSNEFDFIASWPRGDTVFLLSRSSGEYMLLRAEDGSVIAEGTIRGTIATMSPGVVSVSPAGYAVVTRDIKNGEFIYNFTVVSVNGSVFTYGNISAYDIAVMPCPEAESTLESVLVIESYGVAADLVNYYSNGESRIVSHVSFTGNLLEATISPYCRHVALLVVHNKSVMLHVFNNSTLVGNVSLPGGLVGDAEAVWSGGNLLLSLSYVNNTLVVAMVNMSSASITDMRVFKPEENETFISDTRSLEYQAAYTELWIVNTEGNDTYTYIVAFGDSLSLVNTTEKLNLSYDPDLDRVVVYLPESGRLIYLGRNGETQTYRAFETWLTPASVSRGGKLLVFTLASLNIGAEDVVVVSMLGERSLKIVTEYEAYNHRYAIAVASGWGSEGLLENSTSTPCGAVSATGTYNVSLGLVARLKYNESEQRWTEIESFYGALATLNLTISTPKGTYAEGVSPARNPRPQKRFHAVRAARRRIIGLDRELRGHPGARKRPRAPRHRQARNHIHLPSSPRRDLPAAPIYKGPSKNTIRSSHLRPVREPSNNSPLRSRR